MSSICKHCKIILNNNKDICFECYDDMRTKKIFICCYKCCKIIKIYETNNINNIINLCDKCI
jgi:hypothetical protein